MTTSKCVVLTIYLQGYETNFKGSHKTKQKHHNLQDPPPPPPSFLKTVIALGYFFSVLFSDHLGSQVHPETNFGEFWVTLKQNNTDGGHNSFQQNRGDRGDT